MEAERSAKTNGAPCTAHRRLSLRIAPPPVARRATWRTHPALRSLRTLREIHCAASGAETPSARGSSSDLTQSHAKKLSHKGLARSSSGALLDVGRHRPQRSQLLRVNWHAAPSGCPQL